MQVALASAYFALTLFLIQAAIVSLVKMQIFAANQFIAFQE